MQGIVTQFYLGLIPDNRGRTVDEILSWDPKKLEEVHDYIQWLFPLNVRSAYNAYAPLVGPDDAAEFRSNPALREKLLKAFGLILAFYGFTFTEAGERVIVARYSAFDYFAPVWLTPYNHNFLRISRIIASLRLLGLEGHATVFMAALEDVYREYPQVIGAETLGYWRAAALGK